MKFESEYITMVFVSTFDNKKIYNIGLSKKNQDGGYDNGYIQARFIKGVELENKTKIKVKDSWLSFNKNERKTFPFVFINEFETLAEPKPEEKNPFQQMSENIKTEANFEQIEIQDSDLPF